MRNDTVRIQRGCLGSSSSFLPQTCDVYIHGACEGFGVIVPHFLENLVPRKGHVAVLNRIAQELELARQEIVEVSIYA